MGQDRPDAAPRVPTTAALGTPGHPPEEMQSFEIAPLVEWLDSAGLIALNQCCRRARSLSELQVAELRRAGWENFLPRALAFRRLAGLAGTLLRR